MDIAIVRLPDPRYLKHHRYPEDIYWLIEVADTPLSYVLDTKRLLYAASIQEYWTIEVDQLITIPTGQQISYSFAVLQSASQSGNATTRKKSIHQN